MDLISIDYSPKNPTVPQTLLPVAADSRSLGNIAPKEVMLGGGRWQSTSLSPITHTQHETIPASSMKPLPPLTASPVHLRASHTSLQSHLMGKFT